MVHASQEGHQHTGAGGVGSGLATVIPVPGRTASLGEQVIAAVIPERRCPSPRTPGLPVARLAVPERDGSAHYALTAMDTHGRLADRSLLPVLGWHPGQSVAFTIVPGALLIRTAHGSATAVTRQGHLRLPAALRYSFGLTPGDRILLAAFPDRGVLVAYPMVALDAMVLAYHRSLASQAHQ